MAGGQGQTMPMGAQPAVMPTPHQGPNIFDQSANAFSNALSGANSAMTAARGIRANVNPGTVTAQQIAAGQLADTDLSPYMNPFTQSVIDVSVSDLERARQQAMIQAGGAATAANAFGGSRHGVAMAETNRAFDDNMARTIAGLNQANFQQAQQAGQFDIGSRLQADMSNQGSSLQAGIANQQAPIQAAQVAAQAAAARAQAMTAAANSQGNLANLGFGMGMGMNNAMMGAGALQQAQMQQLFDQAAQQYGGWSNSPANSTQVIGQALGAVPGGGGQTQSTTSTPGLLDVLGVVGPMFCWVAREVYGPTNPAWLEFREWMLTKAPNWLRNAYGKHGPKWAEWVKRNPWSKRILRPLMDSVKCS